MGHEAGSETVRGGYVWIATRLTAALAVNWLTANSARDPAVIVTLWSVISIYAAFWSICAAPHATGTLS